MDLEDAGICEGISEVIGTTKSASGEPNAAPIGIITTIKDETGGPQHFMKLYRSSRTLANVLENGMLAANVTHDAVIIVKTAFGDLTDEYFTVFANMPVLKEANAWVIFACDLREERTDHLYFQMLPRAVEIKRNEVKAINRGLNAVIEATILATRYELIEDEREKGEMRKLMVWYATIVKKCGGRREKDALGILYEKVLQRHGFRVHER